jgi:gas vesicle protein
MNTTIKTLSSLALFAAAGYVAGLLMAPEKGSKTRKKLKKDANKKLVEFEKMSSAKINEGQEMYRKGVNKLVDTGDQLLKSAKESIEVK